METSLSPYSSHMKNRMIVNMSNHHILLTTDQSQESLRAFAPAAELARALQARVTVLHVVPNHAHLVAPAAAAMPAMHMDPSQAAKDAQNALELLRDQFTGVKQVDMDAVVGSDIAATIVDQANKHGADYICMATHGHAGIKRLVLGSIAEQVLRHSSVPVVIYPPRE